MCDDSGTALAPEQVLAPLRPIEPAATAVAAFVAPYPGVVSRAARLTCAAQFRAAFGDWPVDSHLADSIQGYFNNGGTRAYVVASASVGSALADLDDISDATLVCVPDLWRDVPAGPRGWPTGNERQEAVIAACRRARNRMAILDAPPGLSVFEAVEWRRRAGHDSPWAAAYHPWLAVGDGAGSRIVPPSGHVAGVWARCDADRGAPGPVTNEVILGVTGAASTVNRGDQQALDAIGVNAIRAVLGRGVRLWGSRTLSHDPRWRSAGVRRLVNHVEATLRRGTRWAADELDDPRTPERLARSIRSFLFRLWVGGALAGHCVDDAFRVRCEHPDATDDLRCEVLLAPRRPGEFVGINLAYRSPGGVAVTE